MLNYSATAIVMPARLSDDRRWIKLATPVVGLNTLFAILQQLSTESQFLEPPCAALTCASSG
jgi:hypothetical protein